MDRLFSFKIDRMEEQLNQWIQNHFSIYLEWLRVLIGFQSTAAKEKERKDCLAYVLQLAQSLGMEVRNLEGEVGLIWYGKAEERIGVFAHIDVVEAKEQAFILTQKKNCLYGRGVVDDKGPLLACLFVLWGLIETKVSFQRSLLIVVGSHEEVDMKKDLDIFLRYEKEPSASFVPDSSFPMVSEEAGMAEFAIKFASSIRQKVWMDQYQVYDGNHFSIRRTRKERDTLYFLVRYGKGILFEAIQKDLVRTINEEDRLVCIQNHAPKLFDERSAFGLLLHQAYQRFMKKEEPNVKANGLSYAHFLEWAIPFGPQFPGVFYGIHQDEERVSLSDLLNMVQIYGEALKKAVSGFKVSSNDASQV